MERARRWLKRLLPRQIIAAKQINEERRDADLWLRNLRQHWSTHRPATLNDKIQYKMALDRRPLLNIFADKLAVREYVAEKVGDQVLNEVYQVAKDPAEIDLDTLPDRFVVKPTHGSGAVIIIHDQAEPDADIPAVREDNGWMREVIWVRKQDLDRRRFDDLCRHWLNRVYCPYEWAYLDLEPKLIVERFLEGPNRSLPRDYKLRVYHGKVAWLQAHCDKASFHTQSLHWPDWTPIPVQGLYPRPETPPDRPRLLEEMVAIGEALGVDTDMIRVDLYEVGGRVIFGELTNYPAGGTAPFHPPEYNTILGEGWEPPQEYR